MINPTEWICNKESTYSNLSPEEKKAIGEFFLIWSYFESQVLSCNANRTSFSALATTLLNSEKISEIGLNELVIYFKDRYLSSGEFNDRYNALELERSGNPSEVNDMLLDNSTDQVTKLIGCLFIVYRFRNNLFHGPKWRYKLSEQESNMTKACQFMIKIIDNT
ncbi:Apea-like HEPN domain-containing protein [Vibrio crassostreae]|nr:Apea-like HEPN domain-containing protein [Vibrio crassostreae]CAK1989361.1 Apea-like HEPN domain-containing protein [Vibrio crassostreae]CAK1994476.1 Apea-like HEPN domain-containing protein [Vibrio crassostreae]CAK2002228.1 Apea-like HEPN domain-containing protein [Vibrio crassostreae]CAK2026422.1 Apea-like HEPN domain-containing protein [Vibrio crassostreae]